MHIGKHIVRVGWLGLHAALWAVPVLNIIHCRGRCDPFEPVPSCAGSKRPYANKEG